MAIVAVLHSSDNPLLSDQVAVRSSSSQVWPIRSFWKDINKTQEKTQFYTREKEFWKFGKAIEDTKLLKNGWDSYEAPAPTDIAISATRQLLNALKRISFLPTTIVPSAEGGIAVYFMKGDKIVFIENFNTGDSILAMYDSNSEPQILDLVLEQLNQEQAIEKVRNYLVA